MALQVKVDSYVVETNVHFPTDLNLLFDCGRKCLDIVDKLGGSTLGGWREVINWRKKLKKYYRRTSEVHRKKGGNYTHRLQKNTRVYLQCCKAIKIKVEWTLADPEAGEGLAGALNILLLRQYYDVLIKHIDLVNRRILKGEKIPHSEKMFSIFEPHTEWINKGKMHKKVELGHQVVIATDQNQFILYHEVMEKQVDVHMTIPSAQHISDTYTACHCNTISYDRNYYSANAKAAVGKLFDEVIMPKPGKTSRVQQEEESTKSFKALRMAHSAVEANINQLEHHGLNQCPDKGIHGFKRYVALGVVAYNLHRLGNLIKAIPEH